MTTLHDTFTGTNGTNLTAHTADDGGTWTVVNTNPGFGNLEIDSNQLHVVKGGSATLFGWRSLNANCDITLSLNVNGDTGMFCYFAMDSTGLSGAGTTGNGYAMQLASDDSSLGLKKVTSGTLSTVQSWTGLGTFHALRTLRVRMDAVNGLVDVWLDGTHLTPQASLTTAPAPVEGWGILDGTASAGSLTVGPYVGLTIGGAVGFTSPGYYDEFTASDWTPTASSSGGSSVESWD